MNQISTASDFGDGIKVSILARHPIPGLALRPLLVVMLMMVGLLLAAILHHSLLPRIRPQNQQTHLPGGKSIQDNEGG